jgi:hypothetical protein
MGYARLMSVAQSRRRPRTGAGRIKLRRLVGYEDMGGALSQHARHVQKAA